MGLARGLAGPEKKKKPWRLLTKETLRNNDGTSSRPCWRKKSPLTSVEITVVLAVSKYRHLRSRIEKSRFWGLVRTRCAVLRMQTSNSVLSILRLLLTMAVCML